MVITVLANSKSIKFKNNQFTGPKKWTNNKNKKYI